MKKSLLCLCCITIILSSCISIFAQTAGTLTCSFTPVTKSPGYSGTKNHLAVWIQTSTGAFVKTKLRYAQVERDHLPTYAVNSGGTASNCTAAACNKTDAITGATLPNFTAKTIVWDGKNVNGTANGTTVPDGVYKVTIEETWNHGTSGTIVKSYTFTKGPNADHQTPANDAYFTNIKLDWVPAATGLTVATSVVNVKCKGENTGSATATATGTPPYTYTWNTAPVQNTTTATGLAAGTYSVTVKDANGTTTAGVVITEPATGITANITTTKANCGAANGTASAAPSGGSAPYTYLWSNSKTTSGISNLAANTYSVTIKDANGCSFIGIASVVNSGAPAVTTTPTNASSCSASDGSVTSSVSGGTPPYSYLWSNNKTTPSITGLPIGSYMLTVTDAAGCIQTSSSTVGCVSGNADAGIVSIQNPAGTICGSNFTPKLTIRNFGTATLTSCTILYHVDVNPNQTFNWSGSLATGASVNVTLPSISATAGSHIFSGFTSNPNGVTDVNSSNDMFQSSFTISNTTAALPFVEGFEAGTAIPSGWTIKNPDNDAAWEINTTVALTGNNSIGFNNCDGNGAGIDMTGTRDRFITGTYDFTGATSSARLSFDIAYAVYNYKGQIYADSLAVFSSQDCGNTWNQLYLKGGYSLSGITTTLSCWTPVASDWRTENINLSSLAGQSSVMFAFENRSGWGEWIYLDNLNITAITGVEPVNPLAGFRIYPNPASASITLEGACNTDMIYYSIRNVVGAEITTGEIKTTGADFNEKIQLNGLPKGMYFVIVGDGKYTRTKKLSVQ